MMYFSTLALKANTGFRTLFNSTLWLLALLSLSLSAQTFEIGKNTYTFNSTVNAVVTDNAGNTYIGGDFTSVGLWSGLGAKFSSTGTWDNTTVRVAGNQISAVVAIPTALGGGWYIGGSFTSVNGQTRNRYR